MKRNPKYSSGLNFSCQHVSPLYTLTQLHGMENTQFLSGKRYFRRAMLLLNIFLISYGLHSFWIFSAKSLIEDRQTVMSFWLSFSLVWSTFLKTDVILSGLVLRWKLFLNILISILYASLSLVMVLHYIDGGSGSLSTDRWSLAFDIQITLNHALCKLLIHIWRINSCVVLSP